MATVSVAHASLGTFLKFQHSGDMQNWLANSFKKVVCVVNEEQFEAAKLVDRNVVFTESSLPDNNETCIGFCPRDEYPAQFKKYRLFGTAAPPQERFTHGRLCIVNGFGDLMMDKSTYGRYINNACMVVKLTKSGRVQVALLSDIYNGVSDSVTVSPSNIELVGP